VQQARDRAREDKQAVNDAKRDPDALDPAAKRRAAKVRAHAVAIAPTVAETAALFLDDSRRRKKAKRTIGEYERQLARDILPSLGHIKIADLAHRDIRKLHDGMSERPVTANRVFALLSAICNFAESHELRPSHSYPCGKVRKYEEQPNRPVLSDEEYVALGAALSTAEQVGLPVAPTFVKKDAKRGGAAPLPESRLRLRLHGVAPTDVDLGEFLAKLQGKPFFKQIELTYIHDRLDSGHVMREFEIAFVMELIGGSGGTGAR